MSGGNPENLRKAARAKSAATQIRAELGLRALVKRGAEITFQSVAAEGRVSRDFLYRSPELRGRIEQLRDQQSRHGAPLGTPISSSSQTSVVRTLTLKLEAERRKHRCEVAELRDALAAAHGRLLQLSRTQSRP